MKYLLFMYPCGDDWDEIESNHKLAHELGQVVNEDEIRYVYGEAHSIFHFKSTVPYDELADIIKAISESLPENMFVLIKSSPKVTSNMAEDHLGHLMSEKKRQKKLRKPKKDKFDPELFSERMKKLFEDSDIIIENLLNKSTCNLTIDEILDKISQKGINSLTKAEKDKLDKYSGEI